MPVKRPSELDEAPQAQPQVPPPAASSMGAEYTGFVWQQLHTVSTDLGKVQQAIEAQTRAVEKVGERLDALSGKVGGIQTQLKVAGAVGAIVLGLVLWIAHEVWDVVKPTVVERLTTDPHKTAPPPKP